MAKIQIKKLTPKLMLLVASFILFAEMLIFLPSLGNFRATYIEDKLTKAEIAISAIEATGDMAMLSAEGRQELLDNIGAFAIYLTRSDGTQLVIESENIPTIQAVIPYDTISLTGHMIASVKEILAYTCHVTLFSSQMMAKAGEEIKVIIPAQPLTQAMLGFAVRVLLLSLVITIITTFLLFASLNRLLLAPLKRLIASMVAFRDNPENAHNAMIPTGRIDELGIAETELAAMQNDLRATLKQKERLAALGTAVAKINHDLRGILSTASLLSDRLTQSNDPEVSQVAPRLLASIDQAAELCRQSLLYASSSNTNINSQATAFHLIAEDVLTSLKPIAGDKAKLINDIPPDMVIKIDPSQFTRVLHNLTLNALQAGANNVRISVQNSPAPEIYISDNGHGLPDHARAHLFEPFTGSTRTGGTGLGLAISAEIIRAHGGELSLVKSDKEGTIFSITLETKTEETTPKIAAE